MQQGQCLAELIDIKQRDRPINEQPWSILLVSSRESLLREGDRFLIAPVRHQIAHPGHGLSLAIDILGRLHRELCKFCDGSAESLWGYAIAAHGERQSAC